METVLATNQLLHDLQSCDLSTDSRIVSLTTNQVLYEQGEKIDFVYFPLDSVVSNLAIMEDGTTLETSMVGREGLVGISAILGKGFSKQWSWVLISGEAAQIETKVLDKLLTRNEMALKKFLSCYRSLVTQISQRSICNSRHTLLERLACWLLMIHDRVGDVNLRLTQGLIASRVGARRVGVTIAAGLLQDMNAIEYRRRQIHIINREVLEAVVCECYSIVQTESSKIKSEPGRTHERGKDV
ncbi:MAG TPA: Crp/Fnr family transcriptional regulator [Pyrinomonadaceae bacterium]|nr:Crp/Fnr family transcriptional regulator [Pyrinomonadaceae bacterium]